MYERFYDLRERPFSLSPDPDYLYPSRVHTEALSYLRYGLEGYAGFIVLTGEIGSGKTTLLQTVLRGLDHQTSVSRIVNTLLQPRELLEAVLLDFGLEARPDYGKPHLLRELARFLVGQRGAGRMALLVIDEAQNLALPTLEEVRMLSNLETEKSKLLQIVLVGQPSLRDTLGRPELEQLRQRVGVSYHLGALDAADTAAYIRHRMRRASIGAPVEFPPSVSDLVHHHSGGLPRTINLIADAILLFAYGDGQRGLSIALARAAIDELETTGVIARAPSPPAPAPERPKTPSPADVSTTPQALRAPKAIDVPAEPEQMWRRPQEPRTMERAKAPVMPPPVATQTMAPPPIATQTMAPPPIATQTVAPPPAATQTVVLPPVAKQPVVPPPVAKEPVMPPPVAKQPVAPPPVARQPVAPPPVARQTVAPPPVARQTVALPPVAKQTVMPPPVAKQTVMPPPVATQTVSSAHVEGDLPLRVPENAAVPAAPPRRERTIDQRPSRADERSPASTVAAIGATALAGVAVIAIAMAGVRSIPDRSPGPFEVIDPTAPRSPLPASEVPVPAIRAAVPVSVAPTPAAGTELAARGRASQPRGALQPIAPGVRASAERQAARQPAPLPEARRVERLQPLAAQPPSPVSAAAPAGPVSPRPPSANEISVSGAAIAPAVSPAPPGVQTSTVAPTTAPAAVVAAVAPPLSAAAAAAVTGPAATPPAVTAPLPAPPSTPSAASATTRLAADASIPDDGSVQAVLNQYRRAYSRLDVPATRAVWPTVNDRALSRAFESLESQELDFSSCQISVTGNRAVASCGGRARYVPRVGSQGMRSEPRQWTFDLRKADERWTISRVETR